MKKLFLFLTLALLFIGVEAQNYDYEGKRFSIQRRKATGKVELLPGANTDIRLNDSMTIRYHSGELIILYSGTERFRLTDSSLTLAVYKQGDESLGQLYRSTDTTKNMASGDTYYQLDLFDQGLYVNTTLKDSTIKVSIPGYYTLSVNATLTHATNDTYVNMGLFKNGSELTQIPISCHIDSTGVYKTITGSGLVFLSEDDNVKVKAKANKTGNITFRNINFFIKRE